MESTPRVNRKKATILWLLAAAFVLGIPSLPLRRYHLFFWAIAFLIEVFAIWFLSPLDQIVNAAEK